MYADPRLIREHIVKLRLNEREVKLLKAWSEYTGQQQAVLLREFLIAQAELELGIHNQRMTRAA